MPEAHLCPHCGTETPADAPEGLCPECLLRPMATDPPNGCRPAPILELFPVEPGEAQATERLQQIGRYQIEKVLGQGGFGVVYRAHDDELHRQVAIKVPLRERVSKPEDVEAYLTEARTVASLDHPHIVPVFDVGRTEDGLCFVVSKFIEGSDLAQKLKETRFSFSDSAALVAVIAEALHYAHGRWLVHRDIKPANILIDTSGKPYLTDFGVALKEGDIGRRGLHRGNPCLHES